MLNWLQQLLASYGYLAVALLVMVEGAGIPFPGETLLLLAAAYAGSGNLWLPGVILAAAGGAIAGDNLGYWIGRRGGGPRGAPARHGRAAHPSPGDADRVPGGAPVAEELPRAPAHHRRGADRPRRLALRRHGAGHPPRRSPGRGRPRRRDLPPRPRR